MRRDWLWLCNMPLSRWRQQLKPPLHLFWTQQIQFSQPLFTSHVLQLPNHLKGPLYWMLLFVRELGKLFLYITKYHLQEFPAFFRRSWVNQMHCQSNKRERFHDHRLMHFQLMHKHTCDFRRRKGIQFLGTYLVIIIKSIMTYFICM